MYCAICGDDRERYLRPNVVRYWSPDDGWRHGRLCRACADWALKCKPKPEDFAWDDRKDTFKNEDELIDALYG